MTVRALSLGEIARAGLFVTIALALEALVAGVAGAASPPLPADEELNSKGVALRLAGDNKGALEPFQQAYDLTHSPRATAQLGIVHQALGRWDLAEPLVAKAVKFKNDPWIRKYETELAKALEVIRDHVAHVEIVSDPAQAELFVNGSMVGRLPLADPVPVVVGQVDLELRAAGYRNAVRTLTVKAYQYEHVFVRLQKDTGAAAVSDRSELPPPPSDSTARGQGSAPATEAGRSGGDITATDESSGVRPRTVLKWTSLGLAGVGLGTGIVASAVFSSNASTFRNARDPACFDHNGRAVDDLDHDVPGCQDWLSTYRAARTWQIVGFVGAGVFAATWLILQLTQPPEATAPAVHAGTSERKQAQTVWACFPSLADPGVSCALRF